MTQSIATQFPPPELALWLRDGVVTARLMNKLMRSSAGSIPGLRIIFTQEELDLLDLVSSAVDGAQASHVDRIRIFMKDPEGAELDWDRDIAPLWSILDDFITKNRYYGSVRTQLHQALQDSRQDMAGVTDIIMRGIWDALGPALAPERQQIKQGVSP